MAERLLDAPDNFPCVPIHCCVLREPAWASVRTSQPTAYLSSLSRRETAVAGGHGSAPSALVTIRVTGDAPFKRPGNRDLGERASFGQMPKCRLKAVAKEV